MEEGSGEHRSGETPAALSVRIAEAIALRRDSSDLNEPRGRPRPLGLSPAPPATPAAAPPPPSSPPSRAAPRIECRTRRAVSMACCLLDSVLYEPGRRPRRFLAVCCG